MNPSSPSPSDLAKLSTLVHLLNKWGLFTSPPATPLEGLLLSFKSNTAPTNSVGILGISKLFVLLRRYFGFPNPIEAFSVEVDALGEEEEEEEGTCKFELLLVDCCFICCCLFLIFNSVKFGVEIERFDDKFINELILNESPYKEKTRKRMLTRKKVEWAKISKFIFFLERVDFFVVSFLCIQNTTV